MNNQLMTQNTRFNHKDYCKNVCIINYCLVLIEFVQET
jgi:hypothetical protein